LFTCFWELAGSGQPEEARIPHWDGPEARCQGCGDTFVTAREMPISAHRALQLAGQIDARIRALQAHRAHLQFRIFPTLD
ncbi:hypothetical protein, partial [Enterobacter sp. JH612]|uniref:hypothetical protein n=1 Tax=Enterobacter sp. JH612 TaxID=2962894 RepID=UPI00227D54BB